MSELKTLCFEYGIEYEDIPGENKDDKVRELVRELVRRENLENFSEFLVKHIRDEFSPLILEEIENLLRRSEQPIAFEEEKRSTAQALSPSQAAPQTSSPSQAAAQTSSQSVGRDDYFPAINILARFYGIIGSIYELKSTVKTIDNLLKAIELLKTGETGPEQVKLIVELTAVSPANDVAQRCKKEYMSLIAEIEHLPRMWDKRVKDLSAVVSTKIDRFDDKLDIDRMQPVEENMNLVEQNFSILWKLLIENVVKNENGSAS